ncbi:MAG: radical SAM protein [Promethearchaeia archaeon]
MKELTIEITDFCTEDCPYCSSDATNNRDDGFFLDPYEDVLLYLWREGEFDRINISGGEPLAHPKFYEILEICESYAEDVVVYTNALKHIRFNASVIDGVTVEANLTLKDNTEEIHVLKRTKQGRELDRPEVKFSGNWSGESCKDCEHRVMRKDGKIYDRPCNKWEEEDDVDD